MTNEIQIYAPFPRNFVYGEDIDVHASNWRWVNCLTIPVNVPPRFSIRPYKWLRFAIGIVLAAEGDLSSTSESLNVIDYDAPLSRNPAPLYYHLSDEEKRRMFPLDPQIARSSVTSSDATPRRDRFRSEVANRDGNICVAIRCGEDWCDAVHLLAHNKGDTYISTVTERRSRDPAHSDVIRSIDSVRNGLLLNRLFHDSLGQNLAFLATPNFALDTPDVDPTGSPGEQRCTIHFFAPIVAGDVDVRNSIRISDSPDWPPTILFDIIYASAVIHHFATQALKDVTKLFWNDAYYPGGAMNRSQVENKSFADRRATSEELHVQQKAQREECHHNREHQPDALDMLLVLPYILLPQDDVKAYFDHGEKKVAEEQQKHAKEKVESWRRDVCENTSQGKATLGG